MLCFVLISVIRMIEGVVSGSVSLRSRDLCERIILGLPVHAIYSAADCGSHLPLAALCGSTDSPGLYHQEDAKHPKHAGDCGLLILSYFSIPGGDHCSSDRNAFCDLESFLIANIGASTGKASLSQVIPLIQLLKNPQRK